MAYTAATGFRYRKSLNANAPDPIPTRIRVANSATLRIGDLCRVNTSGFVVTAGAGNPVGGVVVGLTDENGINVLGFGINNNTGATLTGDDTVVTASDNQTKAHYVMAEVIIDVSGQILWYNDADGSLAQTNLFQFFDCDANSRQVASGTALDTNGQLQLMQIDPDEDADASKGLFRICENQYGLGIDTGTAKVAA